MKAATAVAANRKNTSSIRLIARLRSARGWPLILRGAGLRLRQTGVCHALRQQRHDRVPLCAVHAMPARDFGKCTTTAEAEAGFGIDHTDCDTRRFFAHCGIVKGNSKLAQVSC